MLRLASLGSGSKGNATLIASKDTVLTDRLWVPCAGDDGSPASPGLGGH